MKMNEMEGQVSMFDQDIWSGKMSQEHSAVTREKTSELSSKKSQKSKTKMPLFLCLQTESGEQADVSWETDGALLGEFSMHSFGESPKEDVESLLSQILEDNPHPKYCLSAKACQGILTRANRRGKKLPPMLQEALEQMIALVQTEKSATLSTLQDQTLFQPIGVDVYNLMETGNKACSLTAGGYGSTGTCPKVIQPTCSYNMVMTLKGESISVPLMARDYKGVGRHDTLDRIVCYTCDEKMGNTYCWEEQANTLAARDYKQPQAVCYESPIPALGYGDNYGWQNGVAQAVDCRNGTENDVNGALQSNSAHSLNGNNEVRCKYIVRRLTPMECERLQGYPDGWTDIGEWRDTNGKKHKIADSHRYKALGNSIALPPWKWVLKRICACYERDATMASLFDGIGGFPYLWEQLNGRGSCLWASEIEEFPIAVTKLRIGE